MEGNVENNYAIHNLKGKVVAVPLVDETLTKQGYAADAKKVGEELGNKLSKTDVLDTFDSDAIDKTVSANKIKELKEAVDDINLSQAGTVGYNNTESGLSATNMQSAIDEVVANANKTETAIENMAQTVEEFPNNYLPLNGGMIEGVLHIRSKNNGYASLHKNNTDTTDYGMKIVDRSKDNKNAFITVRANTDECSFTDSTGVTHDLFHDGKKPFASYTGNGSAVARTIQTKGIGRLAMVYCSTHTALVTPKGAIVITLSNGEFSWIDGAKASFLNGNLILNTSNAAFNTSNETYYYQVI